MSLPDNRRCTSSPLSRGEGPAFFSPRCFVTALILRRFVQSTPATWRLRRALHFITRFHLDALRARTRRLRVEPVPHSSFCRRASIRGRSLDQTFVGCNQSAVPDHQEVISPPQCTPISPEMPLAATTASVCPRGVDRPPTVLLLPRRTCSPSG